MLQDALLTEQERALKLEVRDFVRNEVASDLLKEMDRDQITYPEEYVKALGRRNLLGIRFPKEYGGRGLPWTAEIAALEEIGVLGMALGCAFSMPSIVGQALHTFGSEDQKSRFLTPVLKGDLISAEALTEPRGGTDFFGATHPCRTQGRRIHRQRTEAVRRRRGPCRFLPRLLQHRPRRQTPRTHQPPAHRSRP